MSADASTISLDTIVSLCKRRGIIFPGSEIYEGLGGTFDYGPVGVELKNNVKRAWWKAVVADRDDMEGLDAAILMNARVWKASGHVDTFHDPLVDCLGACKRRFRADHLEAGDLQRYRLVEPSENESSRELGFELAAASKKAAKNFIQAHWNRFLHDKAQRITAVEVENSAFRGTSCPECGGLLGPPRQFNLMLKTMVGPVEDSAAHVYLRPETAQGIFVNFDNVLKSMRRKLPFGIAQIGKSFRNEITPRNFIFRTREFEQMEIEYFCKPGTQCKEGEWTDEDWHRHWLDARMNWYTGYGIRPERLRLREQTRDELAHYAKACFDVEYLFPIGWQELEGIANRTDFDLKQHMQCSGKDLSYFDPESNSKYVPYVIEPSAGVDRSTLAFLADAYHEEMVRGEKRVVLRLHKALAPYKCAVFPLLKNRPELVETAHKLCNDLKKRFRTVYDDTAAIGKLYRRQDEIGTPFCITVDVQTIEEDQQVTIRDRDSMEQVRLPIEKVGDHIAGQLDQ